MSAKLKKAKKKKKAKLSPAEKLHLKIQKDHTKLVRGIFTLATFKHVTKLSNRVFTFKGSQCDFDDVFLYENILVLCEYTTSQESDVSAHVKHKKVIFDKINQHQSAFIEFLQSSFPGIHEIANSEYEPDHYRVIIAYCSRHYVKAATKQEVPCVCYLDYNVARYFESVVKTIRSSARFELFEFLGLSSSEIGNSVYEPTSDEFDKFAGSVLPEGHSNFGPGFKVVSFYVNPESLLKRVYVLRKWGWREGANVYQRMISRKKVETVRRYLVDRKRVFVNNIIVTLPSDTKLVRPDGHTVDVSTIKKTQPAVIQLSKAYNSIGIIDGQHRVFSYHEGGSHDDDIKKLRKQQNLLVTGIIFPSQISDDERAKFEATLFLEINSNQTNAKSDLKQEIGLLLRPYSVDSIAKRVVNALNDAHGPLNNEFQRYFYEKDKIKTTSVVSYGVRPLINIANEDSLYAVWKNEKKSELKDEDNSSLLNEYVAFCVDEINKLLSATKMKIAKERWTADRKVPNHFLTTTNLNGLIGCLRRLAKSGKLYSREKYATLLEDVNSFQFKKYKSSQYNRMSDDLYNKFLA